jgi:CarD family transcriptional regulator
MIWSRRAAIYEENINSGDPMKIAEVIRDLQRRSAADTMTFSGRQLYLRALERMAQEYAAINGLEIEDATEKIEDILEIPKELDLNPDEAADAEDKPGADVTDI